MTRSTFRLLVGLLIFFLAVMCVLGALAHGLVAR